MANAGAGYVGAYFAASTSVHRRRGVIAVGVPRATRAVAPVAGAEIRGITMPTAEIRGRRWRNGDAIIPFTADIFTHVVEMTIPA